MLNQEVVNSSICEFLMYINKTDNINVDILKVFIKLSQELEENNQINLLTHKSISYLKMALVNIEKDEMKLLEDFKLLHIWLAINILLKTGSYDELLNKYYYILSKFTDVLKWDKDFILTKVVAKDSFKDYIIMLGKYIFDDEFYNLSAKQQEAIIYCFFNLTLRHYQFSIEYKEYMYPIAYNVFLKAINLRDNELVCSIYLLLIYASNGISTTSEEDQNIEFKLEQYIQNII